MVCRRNLRPQHRRLAEITEMIHTASLIHDDVLDESDTRRGPFLPLLLADRFMSFCMCILDAYLCRAEIARLSVIVSLCVPH